MAFAKLLQRPRAVNARRADTVMAATRELHPRNTAIDSRVFFTHAGYFL